MKKVAIPFLGVLLAVGTFDAEAVLPQTKEQHQFSAEDDAVRNSVAIPEAVRALLAKDDMVREAAEYDHIVPEQFPSSWFLVSPVHLGDGGGQDFVLVGRGPMLGANITQFWVVRSTPDGYKIVLQATAHDLFISNKRWHRFREIELLSATATRVHTVRLRFEGDHYKSFQDRWESTE